MTKKHNLNLEDSREIREDVGLREILPLRRMPSTIDTQRRFRYIGRAFAAWHVATCT